MKFISLLAAWVVLAMSQNATVAAEYGNVVTAAEQLVRDGSYERAHQLYSSVVVTSLPRAEQRWVQFRLADTAWRSRAAAPGADSSRTDEARRQLEALVRDIQREEDRDRVWAEVQESLGDLAVTEHNQGLDRYQQALDWWAGARDVGLARTRYLEIVWKMARPRGTGRGDYFAYWHPTVPLPVLENALRIATNVNDRARASYLLAITLRSQGSPDQPARVPEAFEAALAAGKATDWHDDALYNYAEWMMGQGEVIPLGNGQWTTQPNYRKALELFRRLVSEYGKGETRYFDQAEAQIKSITDPQVDVSVPNVFLPGSEIQYMLSWRNVDTVALALYPVDLPQNARLTGGEKPTGWLESINLSSIERIRSWSHSTSNSANFMPGNATLRLDEKLSPGAYVLTADANGRHARDLVLVTDAAVVLKTSGRQALAYVCNALDSSPISNATVRIWERWHEDRRWHVRDYTLQTDTNGLAVVALETNASVNSREVIALARASDRQAFSIGNSYWHRQNFDEWKIFAFTDRPAYRPNETVHWKLIARQFDGANYSTPASQQIRMEITDPQGSKLQDETVTLNAFGSAFGTLPATSVMPLGEYRVQFFEMQTARGIGGATLFRLEEYKLPEFKVSVKTPESTNSSGAAIRKTFRLGDEVEASIEAEYYFGGPVANASVEVVIHQSPYWRVWPEPRPFPWFYEDTSSAVSIRWHRGFGGDQIVKRETVRTDALGRATVKFETPANHGQDLEYRIEARVTDASRREIIGSGTVRVTRQSYYVQARAGHNIYRPQDSVSVTFKALDANDQPVQAEGSVKVTRDYWYEIWVAPDGTEFRGEELKRRQAQSRIWPPPPERPDQKGWQLKFRGYEHDDIVARAVKTDTNGMATFSFTPEREGYYRVAWSSADVVRVTQYASFTNTITADTTVWVANNSTTELGYRRDGIEIIADKDTFRVGQTAPVMLIANTADRYVVFSVEGTDLYSYQLVHLSGTVKLVQLPIEEKHVPNIFLNATLVSDQQMFADTEEIVVPPTKNFLDVEVKSDRTTYRPRDEGTLTITTRDEQGRPVPAEVAVGLVDESVYYIQSDYAGDPRQFFYGSKRSHQVESQSTLQQKSYARLTETDASLEEEGMAAGGYPGEDFRFARAKNRRSSRDDFFDALGVVNGVENLSRRAGAEVSTLSAAAEMVPVETPAQAQAEPNVVVRSDFRATAVWQPDVTTDAFGKATVAVRYPDSTTSWKATARAVTRENQFGISETNTRTRQPLIVRLQAPRFFVVGDSVTISAVINNNTDQEMSVRPELQSAGVFSGTRFEPAAAIRIPPQGEGRADWNLKAAQPGEGQLKVIANSGSHTDAMERSYPVFEHGIEKFIAKSGKARANEITIKLDLPRERKPGSTSLDVFVTPSMAVTMLDALPYLINFPYGCTEQTMSRFLPAVITARTLRDLGLKPEDAMDRVFGGIETNAIAKTQPGGKRSLNQLEEITLAGLERLYDFQHSDGGWGWWKEGESDHWMTAYVVWGLTLARQADVEVRENVIESGAAFLEKEIVEEEENVDLQAFMLHALAVRRAGIPAVQPSRFETAAIQNLWSKRDRLNAYTRALFALSTHYFNDASKARTLVENLANGVQRDDRPDTSVLLPPAANQGSNSAVQGTAFWGSQRDYWRWSESGVEATAFALRAMLAIDPTNSLVEPACNWLIKNRRGAQWSNTRDTAIVILAMNDYLRTSGELKGEAGFEVSVNGRAIGGRRISGAEIFNAPSQFAVAPELIRDANEIRIRQTGSGSSLYFSAQAKFFSTEEPVAPAGSEIFVKREYFKLVGRPTLLKGYVYDQQPLRDGEEIRTGERFQTVVTIEGKNDYDYLVFEDLKPAGFEAVAIRSGESLYAKELKRSAVQAAAPENREGSDFTGRTRWVHQELRDRKVALFVDKLPQGLWEIRYDGRAEVPGKFHALPLLGQAMYVPEIRANGAELRVTVQDN
ncbi:MAG TPA: MG2 domain-containing protein [Verrucomicrobiae bacterium]|nr:MG2 domain-containing protein [Verrucomicrobiae bacterium]